MIMTVAPMIRSVLASMGLYAVSEKFMKESECNPTIFKKRGIQIERCGHC
jgi:hypothetical protein